MREGRPEAAPLLRWAEQTEALGYDSIWVGDSLLARPRHEPRALPGGVVGQTRRVQLGTAVLLPALRNPMVLAHQVATLDQVSEAGPFSAWVSHRTIPRFMQNSWPLACRFQVVSGG